MPLPEKPEHLVMGSRWALAFLLLSALACGPLSPEPPRRLGKLEPGTYTLTVHATEGSKRGATAVGHLRLLERPSPHWGGTRLYGYTDLDFSSVGAPVFEGDAPVPASTEPEAPGVLVGTGDSEDGRGDAGSVLLVGTGSNRNPIVGGRPGGGEILQVSTDGSGIGMQVEAVTAGGFSGRWAEWGIVVDGRGEFRARRAP